MWYLNPKNIVLMALGAFVIGLVILGGIQRMTVLSQKTTIAKQADELLAKEKTIADLNGQVADYKAGIVAAKKAQEEQQKIANDMAALLTEAQNIKSTCEVGENDAKIIDKFVDYWNAGGVLQSVSQGNSDTKTGAKELLKTNQTSVNKTHWTVKNIVTNLVKPLMEYGGDWEKSGVCYETQ